MPQISGEQTASLLYLVLLGSVLAGYFFLSHRQNLGQGLRQAGLWALIFVGVIAGYGLWSDLQSQIMPRQSVFEQQGEIVVPRSADGHYRIVLDVNGTPVRFIVDTGATDIVLSEGDARRAGIDPEGLAFVGVARTANGLVSTARVRLDEVRLGPFADWDVTAVVNGGEMDGSLLGMSYLDRFDELRIGGDALTLVR